jgi:hypothetical protein
MKLSKAGREISAKEKHPDCRVINIVLNEED